MFDEVVIWRCRVQLLDSGGFLRAIVDSACSRISPIKSKAKLKGITIFYTCLLVDDDFCCILPFNGLNSEA